VGIGIEICDLRHRHRGGWALDWTYRQGGPRPGREATMSDYQYLMDYPLTVDDVEE